MEPHILRRAHRLEAKGNPTIYFPLHFHIYQRDFLLLGASYQGKKRLPSFDR